MQTKTKILMLKSVGKNFEGLMAVNDVSFDVEEGQILSVIGPNGAGKTTLFNLIMGVFPPSSGRILFKGKDITHLRSHQIASLGISRTSQIQSLFNNLNVLENVLVGCTNTMRMGFFKTGFGLKECRRDESKALERGMEVLRMGGLEKKFSKSIGALSLKEQKILEFLRAIASQPSLLLLDEPVAGLREREIEEMLSLIEQTNKEGTTILLVEHQMNLVMSISQKVIVLNYGVKISEGSPEEVSQDPEVIHAYLGGDFADTA